MLCAPQRFDAKGEVVDALLAPAQLVAFTDEDGFNTDLGEGVRGLHEAIARGAEKALIEGVDAVGDVVKGGGDGFGGGGRGGGGADAGGKGGEWLLAVGMEEATRFETLLELFESDLERAGADRLEK